MNTFRVIAEIELPSSVDATAMEPHFKAAIDAVAELAKGADCTPGYFRFMKSMEQLGEAILATVEKPGQERAQTPDSRQPGVPAPERVSDTCQSAFSVELAGEARL